MTFTNLTKTSPTLSKERKIILWKYFLTRWSTIFFDLAPSDLHHFPKLKEFVGGKQQENVDVLNKTVTEWLNGQAAEFFDYGIQKLVPRLNKCLDTNGDCLFTWISCLSRQFMINSNKLSEHRFLWILN